MSDEAGCCSHSLHGVEWQDFGWGKWYLASLHTDELSLKFWPVILPCSRQRLHRHDAFEIFGLSFACGASCSVRGTVGARQKWEKPHLAVVELYHHRYRKSLQEYFWWQALLCCNFSLL